MKDYNDLYLTCNVLLLVGVFEKFRNNNLKNYGLCPGHHLSAAGLIWIAMIKITKIEFELIPVLTCIYSLRKVQEVEFIQQIYQQQFKRMFVEVTLECSKKLQGLHNDYPDKIEIKREMLFQYQLKILDL